MTHTDATIPAQPADPAWQAEIDTERTGWYELTALVRRLTPQECLAPGYYRDPDWTVRDLVAHIGTWLAEAEVQLERMAGGTYEGHDIDIDAVNAQLLEAMHDQPFDVAWSMADRGTNIDAPGLVRAAGARRGSRVVGRQVGRRPLRRAPPAPARVGHGARRAQGLTAGEPKLARTPVRLSDAHRV